MTDYGASDTSTTTLGANQFPISEAWVPNTALTAVEGIAVNTDAGGKKSTALRMGMKDGDNVTLGTSTDANTVASVMGRLTKIRDLLNATLTVGGTITEANSAAISTALGAISDAAWSGSGNGSEIAILKKIVAELAATLTVNITDISATGNITTSSGAGSTVTATFGAGVTSWSVDLRGTFSAGTTLQFEGTIDNTNWFSVYGVPIGATTDAPVSSVVGGAALQYQGNATGLQQFRIRCSALQASDNVTTKIVGSVASDGGFITKALPPGTNAIGTVTANAGTNLNTSLLALESGGHLATIDSHIPALGQAAMVGSVPVTMANNQTAMPIGSVAGTAYGADQTNTRQQVSLYGNFTTPGDTAVALTTSGSVKVVAQANAATIIGQVKITDSGGTNQAGVASATGANANGGSQLVAGAFQEVAGQGTGVVNAQNTDLIPSTDVSAYKWASLQLTGTWSMTLQAQLCNDNANFNQVQVISAQTQLTNAAMLNTMTGNGLYVFPITSRYLRVRATTWASNASLVGTLELYTSTPPFAVTVAGSTLSVAPQVSGGPTAFHLIGAATTNATLLKNSIGQVYGYDFSNNSANWAYVKFYNKATAPVPGTDTPIRTVGVPPGGKATYHSTVGIPFSTGIGISTSGGATATTSIQDLDSTAVAVNTVTIDIEYK